MARLLCVPAPWYAGIEILIEESPGIYVESMTVKKYNVGEKIEPSIRIPMESAQELIDGLWQCGLRPTEGSGSAGALSATQKHLEDMRKLLFHKEGFSA